MLVLSSSSSSLLPLLLLRTVAAEVSTAAAAAAVVAGVAAATFAVAAVPLSLQLSLLLSFGACAVRTFLTSRASRASRPRAF